MMVAAAAMSAPTSKVPVVSTVTWTKIGMSLPAAVARALGAVDRGLDLQRVLAGLDQDRIDPAGDQPVALHRQRVFERLIGDMAERRQPRARPDRAEHEAGAAVMRRTRRSPRAPVRPALRLSSNALSAMPNSPSVIGEPPKLLVWIASQPAAR